MSELTPNLSLPLLLPSQAQKHVTHNEALVLLDMLCQLSAISQGSNTPPTTPSEGDTYLVGSSPTGDWENNGGTVANHDGSGWRFVTPQKGWIAFVSTFGGRLMYHDGNDWVALEGGGGSGFDGTVEAIGIGTTADPSTPLTARLNNTLFTALPTSESGTDSLTVTLNKEIAGQNLGLVLQNNYQTCAILGRFGSDATRLAVSADGTNFLDAFSVDATYGIVSQPTLPRFKATTDHDNLIPQNTWQKIDSNQAIFNAQGVFDSATSIFTAPIAGTYAIGAKLLFKTNGSNAVRMQGRFVLNGATEVETSFCENSSAPEDLRSTLDLNNLVDLAAGDAIELQGRFHGYSSAYVAADSSGFWAHLVA